jgi:TolB-like protein/DNA-binding winged helix-turn-helix (wHTH) protein/Flp pilus assembly protein TadD
MDSHPEGTMTTPLTVQQPRYQFGDLTLDVAQRRVTQRGRSIDLVGLNFDLLKFLVESAPNVVSNDDLAEKVWGRHFVSPENIAQRVMLLRQSLLDDASQPRYIETVRNKGYRLVPSVQTVPPEPTTETRRPRRLVLIAAALLAALGLVAIGLYRWGAAPQPTATLADAKLPNSIAILPFENLSPDPQDAYFAAGVHEEIIGRLAKHGNISVIARTSVQRYANGRRPIREIAAELNVQTVMEGSVRYSGDRVRITANLIDSATGASRWSEMYDRKLVDIFGIQEDIAVNIAAALGEELSSLQRQGIGGQATASPEAAALYLKVLGLRREHSFDSAAQQRYLDQALLFDPDFASAYALKAAVYALSVVDRAGARADDSNLAALETLALENANKALALDERSGSAYLALANVHGFHWRWGDALRSYAKAYELSPNDIDVVANYAEFLSWLGKHEEAIRLKERAVQLDPASAIVRWARGVVLAQAGQSVAAASVFREASRMGPDIGAIHHWLGQTEARLGNRDAALTELRTTERLTAGQWSPALLAGLLYSYSRIDQSQDVERLFSELEKIAADGPVGAGTWALAYLGRGDLDQALHWLRTAVESIERHEPDAGFLNLITIKTNVHANPVLDESRFRQLRDRVGALD